MSSEECVTGRRLITTIDKGRDLLAEIERFTAEHNIRFGEVRGIGSLDRASLTFYDQAAREDRELVFDRPMMLLALTGTVLQQGGVASAHVHIVLADDSGTAYGGDISPGCSVFSCEMVFEEMLANTVSRREDPVTGLARLQFD